MTDPELLDTFPPENALKLKNFRVGNLSTTLLIIGFIERNLSELGNRIRKQIFII